MSLRADTAWMGESCVKALGETLLKLTALDLLTMALLFFDLESVQAVRTFAYHTAYQLLIGIFFHICLSVIIFHYVYAHRQAAVLTVLCIGRSKERRLCVKKIMIIAFVLFAERLSCALLTIHDAALQDDLIALGAVITAGIAHQLIARERQNIYLYIFLMILTGAFLFRLIG